MNPRDGMDLLTTPPPAADDAALRAALRHDFGIVARLRPLPGERDRNLLVEDAEGALSVLKLFNPADGPETRALQRAVLIHLEDRHLPFAVPRLLRPRDGAENFTVEGPGGPLDAVLVSFVAGAPWNARAPAPALRAAVGAAAAALGEALRDFDHPAARRSLPWDLMRLDRMAPVAAGMADRRRGDWLAGFVERFATEVRPRVEGLRAGTIHNDLNGDNVLLRADGDAVGGIIDFGDVLHGPRVADLAVACTYGLGDAPDPAEGVADFVEGYGRVAPLDAGEAVELFDLAVARLALRVLMYEWRAERSPGDRAYVLRHVASALATLDRVMALPRHHGRDRVLARWNRRQGAR